ncbi:hypothetical protein ABE137_12730 [Brevibacillus laterosporus]|uniref:hypothetical protein n=1 Tax=Brevibacillus phage Sundance TaxID=1691958 RepID=UPI0006BD2560|nr:hypothetical protein AVT09_gp038 [Brevibacillus phage Sundance]ALA47854.1 hypothetical protein SUNDANCE_38 [Brevibacillus phage Sundance]
MTTWAELYKMKGTYISQVYDVSSNFETYFDRFLYYYDTNDGTVDVYLRISFDGYNWQDWININNQAYEDLFRDEFYNLEYCKLQYKVVMVNEGDISPVFKEFSITLMGSYMVCNSGDVICKPELWITKRNGSGTVKLTNESNGQTLILENLNNNEEVYIDCENEDIVSNLPLTYRYNAHNNVFLEFEVGENLLTGEGDFDLVMRFEFKTLQG